MTGVLWLPSATRRKVEPAYSGGSMLGGPPRAVIHTTEGDSIAGALAAMDAKHSWSHVTWDPHTGETEQVLPADVAARAVDNPAGGVQTNRMGTVCIQIEVVGFARLPFTSGKMLGWDEILAWLDSWGIPRTWPMGPPPAYPVPAYGLKNGHRDPAVWKSTGGYYGHSQVPENDHGDPGAIDITKLTPPPRTSPQTPGGNPMRIPSPRDRYAFRAVQPGRDAQYAFFEMFDQPGVYYRQWITGGMVTILDEAKLGPLRTYPAGAKQWYIAIFDQDAPAPYAAVGGSKATVGPITPPPPPVQVPVPVDKAKLTAALTKALNPAAIAADVVNQLT